MLLRQEAVLLDQTANFGVLNSYDCILHGVWGERGMDKTEDGRRGRKTRQQIQRGGGPDIMGRARRNQGIMDV